MLFLGFYGCNSEPEQNSITTKPNLKMKEVSFRWKQEHKIEDFYWLKDNYIKPGCSKEFVREILGTPLNAPNENNAWLYVKCDYEKKQFSAWYLMFNSDDKATEWYEKPIE